MEDRLLTGTVKGLGMNDTTSGIKKQALLEYSWIAITAKSLKMSLELSPYSNPYSRAR